MEGLGRGSREATLTRPRTIHPQFGHGHGLVAPVVFLGQNVLSLAICCLVMKTCAPPSRKSPPAHKVH